jgi:hypothetical protein
VAASNNSLPAVAGTRGHSAIEPSSLAVALFERGQRRKRVSGIVAGRRRLEFGVGLARIWIDSQDEKFSSQGAEIDDPIDEGFRRIICRDFDLPAVICDPCSHCLR